MAQSSNKTFMTPQRIKKSKESAAAAQRTINMNDATSSSVAVVTSAGNTGGGVPVDENKKVSKA